LYSILTVVISMMVFSACRTPSKATSQKTGAPASEEEVVGIDDAQFNDANDDDSTASGEEPKVPTRRFTQEIQSPVSTEELNDSACLETEAMICEIEGEIIKQMNEYRKGRGLAAFNSSPKLSWVSREWSKTQAKTGRISHLGFPGRRSSQFQAKFHSTPSLSAENVAYSSFGSADAKTIATKLSQMWIRSPGHRRNIVGSHRLIGVGIAKNNSGSYYGTQIFGNND